MIYSEIKRLNDGSLKKSRNFNNKNGVIGNPRNGGDDNKFKFKNSLIITPNLETEFSLGGGIKYIKNHSNTIFMVGGGTYIVNNGVDKIPILLKRGINKQSNQKKLIVEEKYNFEEKYDISQNIILYFEENRVDFQIIFIKKKFPKNPKTVINSFRFDFFSPELNDLDRYKSLSSDNLFKGSDRFCDTRLENPNYLLFTDGKNYMTIVPDKIDFICLRESLISLNLNNSDEPSRAYINFKVFLERVNV